MTRLSSRNAYTTPWAVVALGRELFWLWRNERAFGDAPNLLKLVTGGGNTAARKIDGSLLHEFIIAPNVRASLERLGLVELRYSASKMNCRGRTLLCWSGITTWISTAPADCRAPGSSC